MASGDAQSDPATPRGGLRETKRLGRVVPFRSYVFLGICRVDRGSHDSGRGIATSGVFQLARAAPARRRGFSRDPACVRPANGGWGALETRRFSEKRFGVSFDSLRAGDRICRHSQYLRRCARLAGGREMKHRCLNWRTRAGESPTPPTRDASRTSKAALGENSQLSREPKTRIPGTLGCRRARARIFRHVKGLGRCAGPVERGNMSRGWDIGVWRPQEWDNWTARSEARGVVEPREHRAGAPLHRPRPAPGTHSAYA